MGLSDIVYIVLKYVHLSYVRRCNKQYHGYYRLNCHDGSNTIFGLQYYNRRSNGYLIQSYNYRILSSNSFMFYENIRNPSCKYRVPVARLPKKYL